MTMIRFFRPYAGIWATEAYSSRERAQAMVAFYRQCGTQAYII